ncbi:glycosyltransferase family 1 protein [bacterium 1xD8-6]|nr:glycosyltransferase family 1 protein [bacterium D16-36]RKI72398.1 glycosyltransferase family 1 protein [bacterium 1xD8-6]
MPFLGGGITMAGDYKAEKNETEKKILVLTVDYPNNNGGVALMYVHVRNKYYIENGIDVTVLNFSAKENYEIEGIKVIGKESYEKSHGNYDTLVLHAANIRNHFQFLLKHEKEFAHIVFFFHGHEVLKINDTYPAPYSYLGKDNCLRVLLQNVYDDFKLSVWHRYLPKLAYKSDYIFISNWFYEQFQKYVRLSDEGLNYRVHIINNSVGEIFEKNNYCYEGEKEFDFISIRSYMDGSKYCIDIINGFAVKYPEYKFLIVGKGDFYKYNQKPSNVTWIDRYLKHEEILSYVNKAKCALLPTRLDAQGVMMCEFATYGIPVITSDLDVCREVLGDLQNIGYIDNEDIDSVDLKSLYQSFVADIPHDKCKKFNYAQTVKMEEQIIRNGLVENFN